MLVREVLRVSHLHVWKSCSPLTLSVKTDEKWRSVPQNVECTVLLWLPDVPRGTADIWRNTFLQVFYYSLNELLSNRAVEDTSNLQANSPDWCCFGFCWAEADCATFLDLLFTNLMIFLPGKVYHGWLPFIQVFCQSHGSFPSSSLRR